MSQQQDFMRFTEKLNAGAGIDTAKGGLANLTDEMLAYGAAAEAGSASAEGFNAHLAATSATAQGLSVATKAASIGMRALSMVGNMAIMAVAAIAIQQVIKGIDELAHRSDNLIKAGDDVKKKYSKKISDAKNQLKDLKSSQSEFNTLSQGIDDHGKNKGLTSDQYEKVSAQRNELLKEYPSLIQGYDAEGNAIANNNELMQKAIDLQKEKIALAKEESVNPENFEKQGAGAYEKYKKNKEKSALAIGKFNLSDTFRDKKDQAEVNKVVQDLYGFDFFGTDGYVTTNQGNKKTAMDNMDKIVNGLESRKKLTAEQIGKLTTLSTDYKGYQKKADDALKDFGKDTLSTIPQTVSGYDKLSKSGKNFLSKWTDNQDIAAFMGDKNNGKNDEDKLANLRSETKEFAEKIVGNTDIQDAYKKYNKTFSDTTKQSALSWQESVKEQYNNVVSAMKDGGVDMNDAAKEQLKKTLNLNLDKNGSVLLEDGRNVLDMVNELNKKFESTTEAQNYFSNLNLDGLNNAFQTAIVNSDTFTGSLDQLKQRIELLKNTSATANFTLEGYSQALDTENAGQDYLRIMEGLKETKEAWNKSLVGTDEFKTFAGMISPSGKTDADNFKENYDNIKKYFTEGTSGPEKFLDALTNKTDSAGNAFLKFNEKTQKWSGNIKDTTEAAKKLGMGVEPFEAMLNRLKDYDIKVDFTSTVDKYKEANSQLSKWSENWVKNGGKQGDAEGKEIESFKQKVLEAKQAGETIPDNWLKTLKFKVDLSDLNNQLNQAEKDLEAAQSGSGVGKEKKIESAAETADKVSYELIGKTSVKNGQLQNISGDIKSAKIPVEYEVKGKNITDYVNEVKTAQKSLSEATTVDQKESSINTYLSSLNNLKSFLNTYTSDKLGKDFKFKADTSDVDKKTKEAKDKAKDGGTMKVKGDTSDVDKKTTQAKQNAKAGGTMKINGDTSNVDKKIADTKSKGDKTKIGPVKMEVKPEVAKAKEAVENLKTGGFSGAFNTLTTPSPSPAKPQSNTAQDSGNAKTGKTATVTTTVKAKDEASSVIDKIKKSANSLKNKTISVKAKGNASSVIKKISSALKKLKSKSIKISIKGTASSVIKKISSALKKLKSKTVTVKAKDKASPTIKKTSSGLKKLKSKTVTVKAEDNASGILGNIKSLLSGIKSKTVTVTTSFKQQGSPVSGGGVVNGTANAQGTAGSKVKRATWKPSYSTGTIDEIDDLDIIEQFGDFAYARGTIPNRANADGNWGAKESSTALTGELGQELIVRGNRWYTVGDHGAEFRDIKKGDIIFNHRQTRQLLKNGKITGRAKAYAHGTAFNRGASISGGFKGGKYDNSTKKHSDAVKKDTKETKKHGDQTKKNKKKLTALEKYLESVGKRFDFVEIKLSNLSKATERIANSITEFVSATYKATQLMKQYNSVGKEISGQKKGQSRYTKAYKDFAKTAKKKAPGKTKKAKKSNAKKLDKYFKLVRDPGFNIKNIKNDSMRSAVEQYKEYYDKARACKDAVQELKNTQRELFNQWLNMPIEAAQAKIDKLSKSYDALSAKASVASSGGSGIANLASLQGTQISAAEKDVASKTTAKSKAKSEKDAASKKYSKAKKADKKAAKSLSKNKKKTTKALKKDKKLSKKKQKQISKGQTISTKGLKGKTLKQAKAYNKSAKKRNSTKKNLSKQQKAAKTANSRLSAANTSLSQSQGYLNTLKKQEADAQKYANGPAYEYQNYLLDQQVSNKKAQNDANQKALKDAHGNYTKYNNQKSAAKTKVTNKANSIKKNKKLYKKLNASQKKALSEGKAVSTKGIKDKKLLKQIQDYNKLVSSYSSAAQKAADASNALSTATVNAQTSQAELAQEMTEAAKAMSANIKAFYDAKVAYEEGLGSQAESANKLKQTKGLDLSEADYNKQFEANARKRAVLVEEQQKLQEQLNKSVASGSIKQGSQEWYELQNEITSVENSITDLDTSTEELKDTMRDDVFYRGFERALKAAEALRSSLEAISSVIDEDAMFDDNGYITDYGITAMAINVQTIQSYRDSMKTLLKEREQIEKDYKSGQYSDTQYTEKVQENEKNIADAVKNIKSSEDSVINIIKNQAKAELDAKNKMIEAYQKALQSKKDYYDYDKTLKNSNKEIQILKSKIAALNGVTDAESRAEKARLEAELQEKVDAKNDTIKDHIYQLQVDGLDELKTELNDDYEKYVKKLSQSVEEIDKALSDMANIISGSASNVGDTLESILSHFGINAKDIGLENINIAHAATGGLVKATKRAGDDGLSTLKIDEEVVTADVVQTSRTLIPKLDKIVTNPTIDKLTNMNYSIPAPAFSDGLGNNEFNFNYSGDAVSIGSIEGKISEEDLNRLLDQACQYTRTKMVQDIAKTLGKKPRVR